MPATPIRYMLLVLAIFASFRPLGAQATASERPYIATLTTSVYAVGVDGTESLRTEGTRIQARDQQGRTYQGPGSNEPEHLRRALVFDRPAARLYSIHHQARVARLIEENASHHGPDVSKMTPQQREELAARATTIQGVPCVRLTARGPVADGKFGEIGWNCVSLELGNLKVSADLRMTINGETIHVVTQLVRIEMDGNPDPEWFRVPPDFRIVRGSE